MRPVHSLAIVLLLLFCTSCREDVSEDAWQDGLSEGMLMIVFPQNGSAPVFASPELEAEEDYPFARAAIIGYKELISGEPVLEVLIEGKTCFVRRSDMSFLPTSDAEGDEMIKNMCADYERFGGWEKVEYTSHQTGDSTDFTVTLQLSGRSDHHIRYILSSPDVKEFSIAKSHYANERR